MVTIQKEKQLSTMKEFIMQSNLMAVINFIGMDSKSLTDVRRKMREKGYKASVVKNNISAIALNDIHLFQNQDSQNLLKGNSLFLFFNEEISVVSKFLTELIKQYQKNFQLKKLVDIEKIYFYDTNSVSQLAILPTKKEMLLQLSTVLSSPMNRLTEQLCSPISSLVFSLNEIKKID